MNTKMKKIKEKALKKKKKITTLIYIPTSPTKKAKTYRISYYYQKLFSFLILIALVLSSTSYYIISIKNSNQELLTTQVHLENIISEQNNLLSEKKDLIAQYTKQQTISDNMITEFNNKYSEVVTDYIENNVDEMKISRSGDSDTPSFTQKIVELESIMNHLNSSKEDELNLAESLEQTKNELADFLGSIPSMWPVPGNVVSDFGMRLHPIYKRNILHTGIDIDASMNEPIKAAGSGKVIFSDVNGGYGNCIIIEHSDTLTTYYAHCTKLLAKEGEFVEKGQVIATVGSTGTSTGPHLHFEIRISHNPVNPLKFLNER